MVATDDDQRDDDEDEDFENFNPVPINFEFGSGSGAVGTTAAASLNHLQSRSGEQVSDLELQPNPMMGGAVAAETTVEEDNAMSDWAEENITHGTSDDIHCTQRNDLIPSDWEKLVDENGDSDREVTEADIRFMKEIEQEMILDGLLTTDDLPDHDYLLENDDLLGDEMMEVVPETNPEQQEESLERNISEQVIPISRPPVTRGSSQSPSSKRRRSPRCSQHDQRERRVTRNVGPLDNQGSPVHQIAGKEPKKKLDSKKVMPKSPKPSRAVSRKLKMYQSMSSPKKRVTPTAGKPSGQGEGRKPQFPHKEVTNDVVNTKATKPIDGEVEPRISPEPPA